MQVFYLKCPKFVKSFDKAALEKCIFIIKYLKELLPFQSHSHNTRWSNLGYLKMPFYRTKTYGRYSMFINSIYVWNHLQSCHQNVIFH